MITRYIVGDITETELPYIVHGVNCQDKIGSGLAKVLFTKWSEVKRQYHSHNKNYKPEDLLGTIYKVRNTPVINAYTQLYYGYDGQKYVNYNAVAMCFTELKKMRFVTPIAIPKIGCGLAGGNWTFMEQLINDTVGDKLEIWVYELEEKKNSRNDLG